MKADRIDALFRLNPHLLPMWWALRKAEQCAESGCHQWALAFFEWGVSRYDPTAKEMFGGERKRDEVRILRASQFLWDCQCRHPLFYLLGEKVTWDTAANAVLPMQMLKREYFPNLSYDEYKLVFDALDRGIEPSRALWPRPRRNPKYIALMAAAQTIAKRETAKS